jgi:hypothetical protein
MALIATNSALEPRAYSVGPVKRQVMNFSVASGDVSATITFDSLASVGQIELHGLALTAAPTYSGNTVTLAFVDPAATRYGQVSKN